MITNILAALATEKAEGNENADEFVARLEAHIRDLETLKAWVKDSAKVRASNLDTLIGGDIPAPAQPARLVDEVEV